MLLENGCGLLQGVVDMPSSISITIIKGARGLSEKQDMEPISGMYGSH